MLIYFWDRLLVINILYGVAKKSLSKRRNIILLGIPLVIVITIVIAISVRLTEQQQQPIITQALSSNKSFSPMLQEFLVPAGSNPHDVAPAADGTVWYTAQGSGELG